MELTTPVLFITFARPEYARQSFDAIKRVKPKKLYFYSNKARSEKPDEVQRNEEVRKFVNEIDWECDLHTWFRDEYVDVWTSIPGAINWIYDNEDRAIVIEEDAVCSPAFFDFCQKMLDKYKDDLRIWSICGSNYVKKQVKHQYDYYYSHHSYITGWASWRNRWQKIDFKNIQARAILEANVMEATFCHPQEQRMYRGFLKSGIERYEKTRCWDGLFNYTLRAQGALTIIPAYHLVKNIGKSGSNSKIFLRNIQFRDINYKNDEYIISHEPPFFVPDYDFEYELYKSDRWRNSYFRRIIDRIGWLIFVKGLKYNPMQ